MDTKEVKESYYDYVGETYAFEFGGVVFLHELKGVNTVEETGREVFLDRVTMVPSFGCKQQCLIENRLTDAEAFVDGISEGKYKWAERMGAEF